MFTDELMLCAALGNYLILLIIWFKDKKEENNE